MTSTRILQDTLESGRVTRYHAAPTVPPQGLAHHQWNVSIFILFVTAHQASKALLVEALCHDTGEYVTGDIPFTLKRDHPELRSILHSIETDARTVMLGDGYHLTDTETALLKVCDTLDGLWWTRHHEEAGGPVHGRWCEAYLAARHKWATVLTLADWERADAVFHYCGGLQP